MSSIVTAVFKATIGLLVNKGRDKAAEKLKDGDITDQKIRDLIVREIDDIKSKLDGLARKDLLTSISYFRRGVVYLFKLLDKVKSGEDGSVTSQAVMRTEAGKNLKFGPRQSATDTVGNTVSISDGLKNLNLANLEDADRRALSNAKEEFKIACLKATEAFNNEALSTSDRIQAMFIRVAATILEKVDYPEDAMDACRLCLEELHSIPAVQRSFTIECKQGFWAQFSKAERSEIIATVYRINRAIYDVTLMTCCPADGRVHGRVLSNWPCVDCGEEKLNILQDTRVAKTVRELGMKPLPWSFGQGDEEEHKLKEPCGIAINTNRQFIVADQGDKKVKLFDSSGKFLDSLSELPIEGLTKEIHIDDVATDNNGNIYVLVELRVVADPFEYSKRGEVFVIENTAKGYQHLEEFILMGGVRYCSLTVTSSNKVLALGSSELSSSRKHVDVYKACGRFVRSFGKGILKNASDITATNDGRVMVVDGDYGSLLQVFSEEGYHLSMFHLKVSSQYPAKIAFNQPSKQVVVAAGGNVFIYTENGKFVRSHEHDAEEIQSIAVSGGLVAIACSNYKVFIVPLMF